jgi:hypothetical protein
LSEPRPGSQLDRALGSIGTNGEIPPVPGPELTAIVAESGRVRTRRPAHELAALTALSLLYAAGLLMALGLRENTPLMPLWWMVAYTVAWLAGFVGSLYLALVPRRGAVLPRWRWAGIAATVACLVFTTGGLLFAAESPSALASLPGNLFRNGRGCLGFGLLTALVPAVLAALLLRRAFPVGSRWVAAAIGAGSGSLGGMMLHFHCPASDPLHLGLVHGGVVVAGALLCALALPHFLRS